MLNKTRLLILSMLLLLSTHLFAQPSLEQSLQKKQADTLPMEKVYLHLDKPYYAAGDTLWFKAYVVSGENHQLSAMSNVLNVELIDSRDSIIKNIKLLVKNGLSQGDFDLPFSLESNNYRIRAYTNYMRNAGEDSFFEQTVPFVNPGVISKAKLVSEKNIIKASPVKPNIPDINVQFFPEGGELGIGIPSKIVFKAVNVSGQGINISGVITDEQNNPVAAMVSAHSGMGVFPLRAEAGKTYSASIKLSDSSVKVIPLPQAVSTGYVLNVSSAGPFYIRVIAKKVADAEEGPTEAVTLVGKSGGVVYFQGKSKPGSNSFIATIPKNKFPTGIVQLTLLSAQGEPLNERLTFIQNNDQLRMDVSSEKQSYARQEKIKLNLGVKTDGNKPAQGSFSVSVIDETKVPSNENAENNILSNLLLTSDLKGYVEQPEYYFTSADRKQADDLDVLMLTQGYRHFVWKKKADNAPMVYQPETGLAVSGYLKTSRGKLIPNGKVTLLATGSSFFMQDTTANSRGHFVFNNLSFNDSTKFMLQGGTAKEREDLQISLDKQSRPKVERTQMLPQFVADNANTEQLATFTAASKVKYTAQVKYNLTGTVTNLNEVTIKAKAAEGPVPSYSTNLNGPGRANYIFTAADIKSFQCGFITTCLEGRMPGINLSNNGANSFFYMPKVSRVPVPMLVLIDGNPGDMNSLPPNNIASIEVLSNMGYTAIYGGKGNAGIILVTTKRGADEDDIKAPSPGTITYKPQGFNKVREFYSPQYDNPKTNKEIADLRTTIYWNPMLQTDKDGNASFEYFNAGSKGIYKVVIEGIDSDGNLGHYVYRYKVE